MQLGLRNRDHVEQMRLRERIGNYFKYVDHAMIHNPDPKSGHYMNGNLFPLRHISPLQIKRDTLEIMRLTTRL